MRSAPRSRVLVTGRAGFTGRRLTRSLAGEGHEEARDSFIPRLMRAARDGKGVQVRGDGTMMRDVVHVEHVPAGPGEMPAVRVDTSVAQGLGYKPAYDLKSGLATVWPGFSGSQEADSER